MAMSELQKSIVAGLRAQGGNGLNLGERLEQVATRLASANRALEQAKAELRLAAEAEEAEEANLRAIAEADYAVSKEDKTAKKGVLSASTAEGRKAQMEQHLMLTRKSGIGALSGAYTLRQKLGTKVLEAEAEYFGAKVLFEALKARGDIFAASAELFKAAASIEAVQQIGWMKPLLDLLNEERKETPPV